jgi:uncharacterized membrane protein (UPF0127 family)
MLKGTLYIAQQPVGVTVLVPTTPEELAAGLNAHTELPINTAMYFELPPPIVMTTEDMQFDITMLGLDKDGEVLVIMPAPAGQKVINFDPNITAILEVAPNFVDTYNVQVFSTIGVQTPTEPVTDPAGVPTATEQQGFSVEHSNTPIYTSPSADGGGKLSAPVFARYEKGAKLQTGYKTYTPKVTDIRIEEDALQVLGKDAEVLMNIKGGERIFSIVDTRALVTTAKHESVETLGKLMQEIINRQNSTPPEYTDETY